MQKRDLAHYRFAYLLKLNNMTVHTKDTAQTKNTGRQKNNLQINVLNFTHVCDYSKENLLQV